MREMAPPLPPLILPSRAAALVPDLPYNFELWSPPSCILGELHKGDTARGAAHAAARAYLPAVRAQLHDRFKEAAKAAKPGEELIVKLPCLPVPEAATPAESLSRHEGPVRAVRWHPRLAVLASASQALGIWAPAVPGLLDVDVARALATAAEGGAGIVAGGAAAAGAASATAMSAAS